MADNDVDKTVLMALFGRQDFYESKPFDFRFLDG